MAAKTYLVQLYNLNYRAYRYLTRWRDKYYPTLTLTQKFAVDTAIGSLQALLLEIPKTPVVPDA